MFFNTVWRMKMPERIPRNMLISMRIWRIQRRTQSRLKSFTRARRVARFVAVLSKLSSQMMKKWYGTIVFILARPTDWMPMPVRICWSEKDCRSFRLTGAEVDLRRPRRMMAPESRKETKFVMMKERRVPEPATPASVGVKSGTFKQLNAVVLEDMAAVMCCVVRVELS